MNQLKEHLQQLHKLPSEITAAENFDHIELDEIEIEAALRKARKEKDQRIKLEEWNRKIKENTSWPIPSAKDLFEGLKKTRSKSNLPFQITDGNLEIIKQLCFYFSRDSRFNGNGDKGILLMGKPGTGKTHLMQYFARNPKASYIHPTCKHISELYRQGWTSENIETIPYYSGYQMAHSDYMFGQKELGICFGDLGSESESSNFGNKRNVIEEIIFNRYESKMPFWFTHFTTNLNAEQLEQFYGERLRDRLREMCNVFLLENESWRK